MKDLLILSATGLITMVLGILLLKKEKRLFHDPVTTHATVVTYYDYKSSNGSDKESRIRTMYTMAVEYSLPDGKCINAMEQKGSSSKKYAIGTEIEIEYSREKPDFFIIKGDKSRVRALLGMIIIGA